MARPTSPLGNRWRRAAGAWLTCGNKCDSLCSAAINTTFILSASKVCLFMPDPFKSDEWARTFADHTLFLAPNLVDLMTALRCEGEAEKKPSACFLYASAVVYKCLLTFQARGVRQTGCWEAWFSWRADVEAALNALDCARQVCQVGAEAAQVGTQLQADSCTRTKRRDVNCVSLLLKSSWLAPHFRHTAGTKCAGNHTDGSKL